MSRVSCYLILVSLPLINWAQCAMCRAQVTNNVSDGTEGLGKALNLGIMYLFFTPYLALGTLAFLWFRYSRKNEPKIKFSERS